MSATGDTTDPGEPLRLSFTFPGSASLGAYQAGAVAALSEVIDELRAQGREVHVDAVGGASAGSIVALMFAHCLVEGLDVAEVMHRAWVEKVDVDSLEADDPSAPLGFGELKEDLAEFLEGDADPDRSLGEPVGIHIGLTNLLGLTYPVETAHSTADGITFVDWAQFVLEPERGLDQLLEPEGRAPVDYVLASASHPGAFPPVAIDRSDNLERYREKGITNLPDSGVLWYTDGGLVESEPIGRVVQLAREQAGEAEGMRLHLVVDPRSSGPSGSTTWSDPNATPSWLAGLRRAVSILPTQALQEDLRHVAVANRRLEMAADLVDRLGDLLVDQAPELLAELAADYDIDDADTDGDPRRRLAALLQILGGVRDKEQVDVELISPLEVSRQREVGVSELLAGDLIGSFAGFLSRDIRSNDFRLGWASVREWLPGGLERHGASPEEIDRLCKRVDSHRFAADGAAIDVTDFDLGDLDLSARLRLARVGARVGRILVGSTLPGSIKRPLSLLPGRDDPEEPS